MRTCTCPVTGTTWGALTGYITGKSCPESFGQIQKLLFFMRGATPLAAETFTTTATWTALLAAEDITRVIASPLVSNVEVTPGDAIEFGSGNEVLNGVPIVYGTGPTKITGRFMEYSADVIAAMKELSCYDIDVMFVNENNQIMASLDTTYSGFNVYSFSVSDRTLGGLEQPDWNDFTLSLKAGWSDSLAISAATSTFAPLEFVNS